MQALWSMTCIVGRGHSSSLSHRSLKLPHVDVFARKKNRFLTKFETYPNLSAGFTCLSKKEEDQTVMKDEECKKHIPPRYGKLITVLSLDGGGVRGIISGVVLAKLEHYLQVIYTHDIYSISYSLINYIYMFQIPYNQAKGLIFLVFTD